MPQPTGAIQRRQGNACGAKRPRSMQAAPPANGRSFHSRASRPKPTPARPPRRTTRLRPQRQQSSLPNNAATPPCLRTIVRPARVLRENVLQRRRGASARRPCGASGTRTHALHCLPLTATNRTIGDGSRHAGRRERARRGAGVEFVGRVAAAGGSHPLAIHYLEIFGLFFGGIFCSGFLAFHGREFCSRGGMLRGDGKSPWVSRASLIIW